MYLVIPAGPRAFCRQYSPGIMQVGAVGRLYGLALWRIVLSSFPVFIYFGGRFVQLQRCGEGKSLVIVFRFFSMRFIGLGESLGGWRKAVSRMAAPRGPAMVHR